MKIETAKTRNIVFSLLPAGILFLVIEIILRVIGFQYSDTPLYIENKRLPTSMAETAAKHPFSKQEVTLKKDRYQFWVPQKSLIEGKYSIEKPQGVWRIATLGCSCTWGCTNTTESYPAHLQTFLNQKADNTKKYEVLNAGVSCHSTFQGLQRLRRVVLKYHPDIVTIFYGWNDHWIAQLQDKEVRMRSDLEIVALNFAEKFRTYQAAHRLWDELPAVKKNKVPRRKKLSFRVNPPDYEANLKEMIKLSQEHGVVPVLVTAPMDSTKLKPSWVFPIDEPEAVAKTHEMYNDIVRKVALESNVPIIDLAKGINVLAAADPKQTAAIFSDGIHFTPFGCQTIAQIFFINLSGLGLL